MIKKENYPNAYKEVYVILNNMNKKDLQAIPQSFLDMIKNNMNRDYQFEIDKDIDFEELNLLQETKVILAYLFLNFWGTKEQRDRIIHKFRLDLMKEEKKYNSEEMFKKDKLLNLKSNIKNEERKIIEYKNESLIKNIFNKIKKFLKFKRKK